MASADDIAWALNHFRDDLRLDRYRKARTYYFGQQPSPFNRERMKTIFRGLFEEVKDNLCPAVVDSIIDRLQVIGFASAETQEPNPETRAAWDLWQRNQMDLRSQEVHRESLLTGDGYVIVWPGARGDAVIWPQLAHEITVSYDPDQPGKLGKAAKLWINDIDRRLRLNLYYPDRIEKYQQAEPVTDGKLLTVSERDFVPIPAGEQTGVGTSTLGDASIVPNPYGRVPVVHFSNKRFQSPGVSELADVYPLQDALNKAITDLLVAMEFSSYHQRYVTGLDVGEVDENTGRPKNPPFNHGADKMLAASDPNVRFGEFSATDLGQFLQVHESLRSEIARVSGTPLHYLFITRGDFPSGEAMKSAEARFTKKVLDRQINFGNSWEDVIALAMQIEGDELPPGYRLSTLWETASPRTEREIAETMLMKKALGVSERELLKELGYDDELIDVMLAENARKAQQQVDLATGNGRIAVNNGNVVVPGAEPNLPLPTAPSS